MNTTHGTMKDGTPFTIQHHSDWSGDAVITWEVGPQHSTSNRRLHQVTLPGGVLLAVARQAVVEELRTKLIAFIEDI